MGRLGTRCSLRFKLCNGVVFIVLWMQWPGGNGELDCLSLCMQKSSKTAIYNHKQYLGTCSGTVAQSGRHATVSAQASTLIKVFQSGFEIHDILILNEYASGLTLI